MRSPARGQSRPSLPPQLHDSSEPPRDRPEKPHHLQARGPRPPLGGNKSLTSPFVKQKAASAMPLPGLGKVQPRPRWRRFALPEQTLAEPKPRWYVLQPQRTISRRAVSTRSSVLDKQPIFWRKPCTSLESLLFSWLVPTVPQPELRSLELSTPSNLPLPVACPRHRWGLFLTVHAILRLQNTLSHSSCTGINSCLPL